MNDKTDRLLRKNGLPYAIPVSRWHRHLFERTAPVVLAITLSTLMLFVSISIFERIHDLPDELFLFVFFAISAVTLVAPIVAATWRWGYFSHRMRHIVSAMTYLSFIGVSSVFSQWIFDSKPPLTVLDTLPYSFAVILLLMALEWAGITPMLLWAAKTASRELNTIWAVAGKVLPIILMIVVFAYFSAEAWQITDRLTGSHISMLAGFMSIFALATSIGIAKSEFSGISEDSSSILAKASSTIRTINIYFVIVMTQLIQAAIFFGLFTALLITIGQIALTEHTISSWLTHPSHFYTIIGTSIKLPISSNMVHTAAFIATFATLSFMMSAANDKQYRGLLFDPIFDRIKTTITRASQDKSTDKSRRTQ